MTNVFSPQEGRSWVRGWGKGSLAFSQPKISHKSVTQGSPGLQATHTGQWGHDPHGRSSHDRRVMSNLVPRACDPREGTRGSGIIRCRKPGILAKIELRIPYLRPIRFLPETDYPRASRSLPRIAGSGNEIGVMGYLRFRL